MKKNTYKDEILILCLILYKCYNNIKIKDKRKRPE